MAATGCGVTTQVIIGIERNGFGDVPSAGTFSGNLSNATLGPSFIVDLPHPRDRKALNHSPRFRQLRREISEYLLNSRRERHATVLKKLILPDIEPEDLNIPLSMLGRNRPLRSSERKEAIVEIPS